MPSFVPAQSLHGARVTLDPDPEHAYSIARSPIQIPSTRWVRRSVSMAYRILL